MGGRGRSGDGVGAGHVLLNAGIGAAEVEEVDRLDRGVDGLGGGDLVAAGVEDDVDVETDLLEPVLVHEELGLNVDLHRADLAELGEQPHDLSVVLGACW